MEGIEVIETEWGSPLHLELIALEERARVEWRNSPEAREEMRRLREAPPLKVDWASIRIASKPAKRTPIYQWSGMSL
jgi:hypothetical protein